MDIPYELSGLADVAIFLAGSVACAFHLRLSRWVWATLLGFVGLFLVQSATYLLVTGFHAGVVDRSSLSLLENATWVSRVCWWLVVPGIALSFSEIARRRAAQTTCLQYTSPASGPPPAYRIVKEPP